MQTNNIITNLTDAITAVLDGDSTKATKLLMRAVREMNATTPMATAKRSHKGRKPSMTPEQVASMVKRVKAGETVIAVANSMGVSAQNAYRWHSKVARDARVRN